MNLIWELDMKRVFEMNNVSLLIFSSIRFHNLEMIENLAMVNL